MYKFIRFLALFISIFGISTFSAWADQITSLRDNVTTVKLYTLDKKRIKLSANEFQQKLPLSILNDKNGRYLISLDNKKYTISAAQVKTNQQIQYLACDSNLKGSLTGSVRGITGKCKGKN